MLKYIFIIFAGLIKVYGAINYNWTNNSEPDEVIEVSQCVIDIINKNNFSQATLLFSKIKDSMHTSIITNIAEILGKIGIPSTYLNVNEININKINEIYDESSITVVYIETCTFLIDFTNITLNKDNQRLILLQETLLTECSDSLEDIARKVAEHDITFIYKDKIKNVFNVATYINVLDAVTCEFKSNIKMTNLYVCRNGLIDGEKNINTFPDKKPKDWMRCPISVGMGSLYPFNKSFNKSGLDFDILENAEGSDVEILKIIAQYLNASLKFYNMRTEAENARSTISHMSLIINGSLDIGAGGLYRVFGDTVAYSGIYSRQEIIWIYTVERDNTSWITFVKKCDEIYVFIIFHICYSVIWWIFCYFDNYVTSFTKTLLYAWGALFIATPLQLPRTIKQKILNLFYLLLCLHLSAYVSIQLYSFLTIQGAPFAYESNDELFESKTPVYLVDKAKYFIDDEKYIAYANTSRNCNDFNDCIVKILANKGTTVLIDGIFAPAQTATAVNGEARLLRTDEAILIVYHEMILKKESPLLGRFEKVLSRLFEAGICQKLYDESIGILVIDKARRATQNIMADSYSCEVGCTITMSQCAGAFYAWFLGCILSFFIFCFELVTDSKHNSVK